MIFILRLMFGLAIGFWLAGFVNIDYFNPRRAYALSGVFSALTVVFWIALLKADPFFAAGA